MADKRLKWFPFYPADWITNPQVMLMTPVQEYAYFRLLAFMFMEGGSLSCSDRLLAMYAKLTLEEWIEVRPVLMEGPDAVFTVKDGRITNKRLSAEVEIAKERHARGLRGANKRWGKSKLALVPDLKK